ncbi:MULTISPECIES: hypothetical protein [unclassified Ensifer]|uniref:hypothetical protein n=1 Tax=unclassified Ensifer TaxID=2633371 RepID=UPI003010067F
MLWAFATPDLPAQLHVVVHAQGRRLPKIAQAQRSRVPAIVTSDIDAFQFHHEAQRIRMVDWATFRHIPLLFVLISFTHRKQVPVGVSSRFSSLPKFVSINPSKQNNAFCIILD